MTAPEHTDVLIAGGGYVGLYSALQLERRLPGHTSITLVNPENFMLYQSLLPEVASGTIEPRHVVVPLRKTLRRTQVLTGELEGLDSEGGAATISPIEGGRYTVKYSHLILALGSETRVLPVPGVEEHAVGFQSIAEAIRLRNQILSRMEVGESARDEETRRRALTFVFVGGGYTGVEALAELEDMARVACRWFPSIAPGDMRWILVEATDRIVPTIDPELGRAALRILRSRDIEVHLETQLESASGGRMRLSNGEEFDADTLVWVAGIRPHSLVGELGLPVDDMGRLVVDEYLRVKGVDRVWGAGDCCSVPDLAGEGTCPPSAQYARREATVLGDNVANAMVGKALSPFRYKGMGELITLGNYKGVAQVKGRRINGLPAWLLRRSYYAGHIPTVNRKTRVVIDWLVHLIFRREIVHLGSQEQPRAPLAEAARRQRAS